MPVLCNKDTEQGLWRSTLGYSYFKHSQPNSFLVMVGIRYDFKKPRKLMLNSYMPQYEDCILRIIKVIKIDKVLIWAETEGSDKQPCWVCYVYF